MTDQEFMQKIFKIGFYTHIYNWKKHNPPEIIFINDDWELQYYITSWGGAVFELKYKLQHIVTKTMSKEIAHEYVDSLWNNMHEHARKKKEEGLKKFNKL